VTKVTSELEQRGINVIRGLAMDAPQRANSGHPGTAMALAPLAHVLFTRVMRHDPSEPDWPDRDRFILSAGHASILLYSMLHLTGYGLELDDIKAFRQWHSRTPGHPERNHTPGVEVTTGPLGQGFGNSVGMAIAERWLRARFGAELCDHHTFVIASDGDLMEGVSHEAASLAGHLGLGRVVAVYDDNHITIDGDTALTYGDDVPARFRAYGWDVDEVGEIANDCDALEAALRRGMSIDDKPTLIVLRSHIGWPSPKFTDTAAAHGNPLGDDEIRVTKGLLDLPPDEQFWVPAEVLAMYRECIPRGQALRQDWEGRRAGHPHDREVFNACLDGRGVEGWTSKLPIWSPDDKPIATRVANQKVLDAIADVVPGLVGGGADLTSNTGTVLEQGVQSPAEPGGRQIYFGIREHGMGAAMNGMAMHGGVIPFGGTFFVFSDYMKPAVRLAAITGAHTVFVWTHDSVGLGEDGPTHQPVEHLAALRAVPQLRVLRPADANETAQAWRVAVDHDGPVGLILSRQALPVLEGTAGNDGVLRGAYVLRDCDDEPDLVLIGTGSEVHVCLEAAALLDDVAVRVVSMPSWDLFAEQDDDYQNDVLPNDVPTLAVEAGASLGWERWADDVVALDRFGESAPGGEALEKLGFNPANVAQCARALLDDWREDAL
jgi:transketolase